MSNQSTGQSWHVASKKPATTANKALEQLVQTAQEALVSGKAVPEALDALQANAALLDAVSCVDLLERAACLGNLAILQRLWSMLAPFAYSSWALALALRCDRDL